MASALDFTRCNPPNHWHSIDTHFRTGDMTMLQFLLLRMAANTSIIDICRSRPLGLHTMQQPKLLTLCWHYVATVLMICWRSVDALFILCWHAGWGETVSTNTMLHVIGPNTSIKGTGCSATLGLYTMQHTKPFTPCWGSFSDWGWDHVVITFVHNGYKYLASGYMP